MIHISKFGATERVENVNSVAKIGEIVKVRVYKVEKDKNRIGLEKIVPEAEKTEKIENSEQTPFIKMQAQF